MVADPRRDEYGQRARLLGVLPSERLQFRGRCDRGGSLYSVGRARSDGTVLGAWRAAFVDTDRRRWSGESPVGFRRLGLDGTPRSTDARPFRRLFRRVGTPCLEG